MARSKSNIKRTMKRGGEGERDTTQNQEEVSNPNMFSTLFNWISSDTTSTPAVSPTNKEEITSSDVSPSSQATSDKTGGKRSKSKKTKKTRKTRK